MRLHRVRWSRRPLNGGLSVSEWLRAAQLRPTSTRKCIWQVIESGSDSVTAREVCRDLCARGTSLSMGTICRVLGDLESAGLLVREGGSGDKHRRVAEDQRADRRSVPR